VKVDGAEVDNHIGLSEMVVDLAGGVDGSELAFGKRVTPVNYLGIAEIHYLVCWRRVDGD
jgi:hypothetical protein